MLKLCLQFFRFLLMLVGVISFNKCSSGYKKEGNKVIFNGKEVSPDVLVLNAVFAKNDSTAYFKNYTIAGVDIPTFIALDEHYAKDKNTVYYCDEYREGVNYYLTKRSAISHIRDAHILSFTIISEGYAKDEKRAYFEGIGFDVQDLATLEVINARFVKDKTQVYFERKPIIGSDVKSFRVLNNYYAQDAQRAYYYNFANEIYGGIHPIPCNSASFALLDYPYSKDNTSVFYVFDKMIDTDASTFTILKNGYAKDAKSVFFASKKIAEVDAATFTVIMNPDAYSLEDACYGKDKANIFMKEKKLQVADIASFKILGFSYTADKQNVYYNGKIVKNADPNSFKLYPHDQGDEDAEDAKNKYSKGKKVGL